MMKMMNDQQHQDLAGQDDEGMFDFFHLKTSTIFSCSVDEFLLMYQVHQHRTPRQIVKILDH